MTKQTIVDESLQNGDQTNDKLSIWASILRDVKSSTKKPSTTKCLVVLGDNESGRTTLVARLQGNDDPKRGAGLEYHYIDVKDDDRDDTPKLGVWILDGDAACSAPLLKYAIKAETLKDTVLILVASMTQPWLLLSTLNKWTTLIEEHIDRLKIDPIDLQQLRDSFQHHFQHYIEPNESSTTTVTNGIGVNRVSSSVSLTNNTNEQIVPPLPDGVLSKSLGIPIIVVITKCDVMSTLERENDYKDEQFDFMQYHLRRFSLDYGAALFYTSVKERKNIDKLYKYIIHQCYDYPFAYSASVIDRDAIFIPAGWDNPRKVEILLDNLHRIKQIDDYSDVFVKPHSRRPLKGDEEIIMAEDDQEFLAKLQLTLNRTASPGRGEESGPSREHSGHDGPSTTATERRPTKNVTAGEQGRGTNERALTNFFSSLLTKRSAGATTPTAATPAAQRITAQSPTTPTGRRLQQNPLTFTVTPPPGRSRTPTSHKSFLASLNADTSPKVLSPVNEQQSRELASSPVLPTIVRTPVDEGESIKLFEGTLETSAQAEQEKEPVRSPSSHTPTAELTDNDDLQATDQSTLIAPMSLDTGSDAEDQKISSPTDQSKPPTPNLDDTQKSPTADCTSPRFLSSPTIENIEQSTDEDKSTNQVVSQNNSDNNDKEQTKGADESSNSSRRNSTTDTPAASDLSAPLDNDLQEQSSVKDETTLSDTNLVNIDPDNSAMDDKVPSEESNEDSPNNYIAKQLSESQNTISEEEQQADPTFMPLSYSSPSHEISEESQVLNSAEDTHSLPVTEEHHDTQLTDVEKIDPSLMENDSQQSPSDATTFLASHASQNLESDAVIQTSPIDSDVPKHESDFTQDHTTKTDSPSTTPSQDQQRSRSPSPAHSQTQERSRPPSPTAPQEKQRSRSPSPAHQHEQQRSRSSSPANQQEEQENQPIALHQELRTRSPSPTLLQEAERSRSPSPAHQQEDQRSRSPSPVSQHGEQRTRSPSPSFQQERRISPLPSPTVLQEERRSRSPSPAHQHEQQRSRSSSPANQQEKQENQPIALHQEQRTRSPSPTLLQEAEKSRSSSPVHQQEDRRSRSPSSVSQHGDQRTRSPSPSFQQERQTSRSPSPIVQQERRTSQPASATVPQEGERSRSPSPSVKQEQRTSRPSSPTVPQEAERSRSPSPSFQQEPQRSRSPSPSVLQEQQTSKPLPPSAPREEHRTRSPSPANQEEERSSPSPSSTAPHEERRSRSPSPAHLQEQETSRPLSPIAPHEEQRTPSSSSRFQEKEYRSRSPSPSVQQERQTSRPASPAVLQEEDRSQSPSSVQQERRTSQSASPIIPQEEERSRSPSPHYQEKTQRSHSPSPANQREEQGSPSSSPTIPQEEHRNRSPSPGHQLKEQRSRSPSVSIQQERRTSQPASTTVPQEGERSGSPSPNHEGNEQRSRSPSPANHQGEQRSPSSSPSVQQAERTNQSPSPTIPQERERSRSPSPNIKQEQRTSRPSLPTVQQERQRSRSPSPSVLQEQQTSQPLSPTPPREEHRTRSPSPANQEEEQRSRSPSPARHKKEQRSRSPSPIPLDERQRSRSPSLAPEQKEQRSRSPSPLRAQEQKRSRTPSPSHQLERQESHSASPIFEQEQQMDRLASSDIEQKKERSRSPSPLSGKDQAGIESPLPSVDQTQRRSRSPSPIVNRSDDRSRSPSPIAEHNAQKTLAQAENHQQDQPLPLEIEQKSERSPSLTHQPQRDDLSGTGSSENHATLTSTNDSLSPIHLEATIDSSPVKADENRITPLTPSSSSIGNELTELEENRSKELFDHDSLKESQTLKSLAVPENHSPISSIPSKTFEHQDHHGESPIKAPTTRQSNITRSKSQSAVARPNTLPFTPNNDDLDGLYTSNDYDDEDEMSYNSEYHHNSAPSTVSIEYRRCSLFDDSTSHSEHVPPDPNDISKRLSIVEQSRNEDGEASDTDPTTSTNT